MSDLKLKTATRTQGNNKPLKDGVVKPKTFDFAFEEVDPIIAAFRRMVRGNEFDICEMAITTYICAKEHGKPMTAVERQWRAEMSRSPGSNPKSRPHDYTRLHPPGRSTPRQRSPADPTHPRPTALTGHPARSPHSGTFHSAA